MNTTLCNMCMIEDTATGRVLVQHRLSKPTNPWCGLTFPGGHVQAGESIMASTIREIREETGLTISHLRLCGIVEWEVPKKPKATVWQDNIPNSKYLVFMFRTCSYHGTLKSSPEGEMEWMTLAEMRSGDLAPHMEEYIRVLLDDDVVQAYGISGTEQLYCLLDDNSPQPKFRKFSPEWFFQNLGCKVQSLKIEPSIPQIKLLEYLFTINKYICKEALSFIPSHGDSLWNLPIMYKEYGDLLPLLKDSGIIKSYEVIDNDFLRKKDFDIRIFHVTPLFDSHGDLYEPRQGCVEDELIIQKKLQDYIGWVYIRGVSRNEATDIYELATLWQAKRALTRFSQEHPSITYETWHEIKLSRQDGSPLTDCDVLVRVNEHFYFIEVKKSTGAAESYRSGRQGKSHEMLLSKTNKCTHLYCIGEDDSPPFFSQDYYMVCDFDVDFYNLLCKNHTPQ